MDTTDGPDSDGELIAIPWIEDEIRLTCCQAAHAWSARGHGKVGGLRPGPRDTPVSTSGDQPVARIVLSIRLIPGDSNQGVIADQHIGLTKTKWVGRIDINRNGGNLKVLWLTSGPPYN